MTNHSASKVYYWFAVSIAFSVLTHSCNNTSSEPSIGLNVESSTDTTGLLSNSNNKIDTSYYRALLTGTLDVRNDTSFVLIPEEYSSKSIYLHKDAASALVSMVKEAAKDGIQLRVISGYRSFNDQVAIWNRKWGTISGESDSAKCKRIMRFSAMPKTSRHHWGTDVDLNSLENEYFETGKGLKEWEWLNAHAAEFGYQCVYSDKASTGRTGYEMERWHWSYVPLSNTYLRYYNELIHYAQIDGFSGFQSAAECRAIEDYVNGVTTDTTNVKLETFRIE